MNASAMKTSNHTTSGVRASACFAAMFWLFAYAILSLRAGLSEGHVPDFWSAKRVVATGVGAFLYLLILVRIVDAQRLSRRRRLGTALALAVPVAATVLTTRVLFDSVTQDREVSIANDLRWLVVWTGYFVAWIAAYVLYGYHRQLQFFEEHSRENESADKGEARRNLAFWVRRGGSMVRLALNSIERFEAEGNYVRVHADDGATGFMRLALRRLQEDLDPDDFIRVHRSTVCRKGAIDSLKRHQNGGLSLILASGAEVPVGRSYSKAVSAECRSG